MTDQLPYEPVKSYPHFELRRYPAHVLAEIHVNATFDRAGNAAFRHLFNYISGYNRAEQKLAMTAPVIQGPAPSQKLAMTAPVLRSGPLPGGGQAADFAVAFVLPAGITAETAPVPLNSDIRIRTVPGSLTAVARFKGSGSEASFARHNEGLQAAIRLAGLTPVGAPRYADFDPPFKPWFLRRNEVHQDVREPDGVTGP